MTTETAPDVEGTLSTAPQEYTVYHRSAWQRHGTRIVTVVNLSVFFILWETLARANVISDLFFPRASAVAAALWTGIVGSGDTVATFLDPVRDHIILDALTTSVVSFMAAMVIAIAIGVPLGLFLGMNRWADVIASPYIWAMQSLPRIALVPLLILILGFSQKMVITIIVLSAVFPIVVNTWAGVKTTDRNLLHAARVFGANRRQIYLKVILPSTVPFVISGVQQGLTRGFVGLIVGELFGGNQGLGYLLDRSADAFATDLLFAVLVTIVAFALLLVQGTRWLESRLNPWRA